MEVDKILAFLETKDIYPFSVFYTDAINNGALSITFYLNEDLDQFLDILEYKSMCDNSGFEIFRDTQTVILTGRSLITLYFFKRCKI